MERANGSFRMDMGSRAVAFGLAVLATSLIFTSTALLLTGGAGSAASAAGLVVQTQTASLPRG